MAPRKKEDKPSANEAADMVLHYLHKQNRPYSAIDVSANLHNKVTKAAAAKILKDLHEQKQIEGRAAGKAMVYHALQNPDDAYTPEQLAALNTQITTLQATTTSLTAQAKNLRTTLSALSTTLSTPDLLSGISTLTAEKSSIESRLGALRAGSTKKVTREERERIEKEAKKWGGIRKRREVIARNVWLFISEHVEGEKKEELWEEFDLGG